MADQKKNTDNATCLEHVAATPSNDAELRGWISRSSAQRASDQEHQLNFIGAVRMYPKAIFWTVVISLVVIMDGYDTALMGSLTGFPTFQRRFGVPQQDKPGSYQLEAKWILALNLGSPCGNFLGIFIQGWLSERIGHRKTILGGLVFITGCIFLLFFAQNVGMLFAGEFLAGLPWGLFTTIAPAYASEVAPVALRAYLETWIVLCWGFGSLLAFGVIQGNEHKQTDWGWRIPFAVQWVWPLIIIPFVIMAPESPWWLVRRGRLEEAEASFERLSSSTEPDHARNAVALMVETTELERSMTEGARWIDCLRGSNMRRTEISCIAWLTQASAGFAIAQFATYFFEQAGLPAQEAYKLSVGQGALSVVASASSMFVTHRFGRRQIYLGGNIMMLLNWLIVGFMALKPNVTGIQYASSALYMLWYALYHLTIGPLAFIVVGETSSTRLRSYTIAIARNAYNIWNIMSTCVAPYVLDPNEGNWKGKSAFLPAGFLLACTIWGFFRFPECKGRTYEELDIMFDKGIPAREFASFQVDVDARVLEGDMYMSEKGRRPSV